MRLHFVVLFTALELLLLSGIYLLWQHNTQQVLDTKSHETGNAYSVITSTYGRVSELMHDTLLSQAGIVELFQQGLQASGTEQALLRGRLLRALHHDYEHMARYNLVQLHFHTRDGRSYLRFHKPEISGDDLLASRPSIRQVLESGRPAQGFEIGKLFHGYRYVFPVHFQGELIGSVETSIDFRAIIRSLGELNPEHEFGFWLRREGTQDRFHEDGALLYPLEINPAYAIEDLQASLQHSSASPRPARQIALERRLQPKWPDIRLRMAASETFTVPVHLGGLDFGAISFLPIFDPLGQQTGYLVGYMAMPELRMLARNYLLLAAATSLLLGALILFVQRQRRDSLALKSERHMLKGITENMLEALFVQDNSGRLIYWNPALERILGFTAEQLGTAVAHELIHAHDRDGAQLPIEACPIRQATLRGDTFHSESESFHTAQGQRIPVEVSCTPVISHGRIEGSITVFRDMTQRLQMRRAQDEARQAAEHSARMKSTFLANMSHEIRTPMNGMIGMLELALATPLTPEQREYLQIAQRSGEMLLALLNDILDVSKVDAGRLTLESVPFDLEELVEDAARLMTARALQKRLELIIEIEPGLPRHVLGDPLRLHQVLVNLLSNAIKFTERGKITLSLRRSTTQTGALAFAVRDTGIGIAPEAQEHIFEAFRQADDSTTRKYGGTGLGLSLSRHLVELMGGTIDLTSAPGQGSCFSFELNLPAQEVQTSDQRTSEVATELLAGFEVLIVDDIQTNRLLARRLLERQGARISEAEDGAQAVQRIEAGERFDLILIDYQMPVMDGPSAVRNIRRLEHERNWPRTPILGQTAHAGTLEIAECCAAGMDEVLGKPCNNRELLAAVGRLLQGDMPPAEAPAAPKSAEPLLDASMLESLEVALGEDLQQVIGFFCSSLPGQIESLQAALSGGGHDDIRRHAHALKGSAGNIGALALSALAHEIEQLARQQEPVPARLGERLPELAETTRQALLRRQPLPA